MLIHPLWQDYPAIHDELLVVRQRMLDALSIQDASIRQKITDYITAPGKYLRAALVLLLADINPAIPAHSEEKIQLAAGIELVHLATLIHDDVIDEADSRRGISGMHQTHSNRIAIYAGDYLLAYALRFFAQSGLLGAENSGINQKILENILKGELSQLSNQYNVRMTMHDYLRQIRHKTALLFAMATFGGYYHPENTRRKNYQSYQLGQAIGLAFQLADDLIDFRQDRARSGKPQFQDVKNGIYTAPVLLTLRRDRQSIEPLLARRDQITDVEIDALVQAIHRSGAFDETEQLMHRALTKADQLIHQLAPAGDPVLSHLLTQVFGTEK